MINLIFHMKSNETGQGRKHVGLQFENMAAYSLKTWQLTVRKKDDKVSSDIVLLLRFSLLNL